MLSVLFGFSMIAETNADMSGDGASGFSGAFELKYRANLSDEGDKIGLFSYRVRTGWAGEANSMVMWKVGLSSDIEQAFGSLGLENINLEHAYVAYKPMDGFHIKVGKFGSHKMFSKSGVLSDDIYVPGIMAKYYQEAFYVKLALINLEEAYSGPLSAGAVAKAKIGVKHNMDDISAGAYVGAMYDGLFNQDNQKTLAKAGLYVSVLAGEIPVSINGHYVTDIEDLAQNATYSAGISVNESDEMHNVSLGVSYYDVNSKTWSINVLDKDYIAASEGNARGVAAELQYNLWENSNLVGKYSFNLDDTSNPHSLVGELTFNF